MRLHWFKYISLIICTIAGLGTVSSALAQEADTTQTVLKPRIEIGTGRLSFYGDVGNNLRSYSPLVGNFGGHFKIGAPLYHFLDFDAYAMYGKLTVSETSGNRRLNFSSQIRMMGAGLTYNFGNFLKPGYEIAPYISIGIAGFEFLSKTDLYDGAGNRYHYWSDGSIRNQAENSPQAAHAIEIQRDYTFETDVRELREDQIGTYPERSFAIPVGVGAVLNLTEHLRLRLGAEMYFTFTNNIDGVTDENRGSGFGNSRNDWFLYTNAGISYNFDVQKKKPKSAPAFTGEDWLAMDDEDQDGDGVSDMTDLCPNTPAGVAVDAHGCPVDGDGDGVPDYLDLEPNSAANAFVDADGVTISDDYFLNSYLFWIDSIYDMNYLTSRIETASLPERKAGKKSDRKFHFKVEENDGLSTEMIQRILSIPDIHAVEHNDEHMFLIGEYTELFKAVERKINLEADGISGSVIAFDNGRYIAVDDESAPIEADLRRLTRVDEDYDDELSEPTLDVVYRVQIGAFENPLSRDIFSDVHSLITIKGTDGLTRYVSGSFTDLQSAANHKVDLLLGGFEGAFVTAYRGGKRISLTEAGAIVSGTDDRTQEVSSPSFDLSLVKFRVQIAAYRDEVPTDILDQFIELGEIRPMRGADGATRYVFGEFDNYQAAAQAKERIASEQFKDAFVIGDFNGQLITAQEAIQMLNQN